MDALAKTWREVRKFGVEAAVFSQSVADIPRDILENSGVKFVLAIEPEAVPETAARLHIDPSRLQRVAYESLPEERVGLVRVEARSPIFVKIYPPPEK
jgi:DNA helicase HerA-like ATPase